MFTVYTYTESLPLVFIVSCTLALDCFVLLPPTSFLPNIRFLPRNTEKTGYHWQLISCNNSYWKSEHDHDNHNMYKAEEANSAHWLRTDGSSQDRLSHVLLVNELVWILVSNSMGSQTVKRKQKTERTTNHKQSRVDNI